MVCRPTAPRAQRSYGISARGAGGKHGRVWVRRWRWLGVPASVRSLRQAFRTIEVETRRAGLFDITAEVARSIEEADIADGLVTLFIRHTSASLVIQENADPDVLADLDSFLRRIVPEDSRLYRHTAEGDDDMPAHIRSALTATQLSIPLREGQLRLGTWQGIYVFEHRRGRFRRQVDVHVLGD
jgi:secondary thiamine-phosphate synthase enzyme